VPKKNPETGFDEGNLRAHKAEGNSAAGETHAILQRNIGREYGGEGEKPERDTGR